MGSLLQRLQCSPICLAAKVGFEIVLLEYISIVSFPLSDFSVFRATIESAAERKPTAEVNKREITPIRFVSRSKSVGRTNAAD